MPLFTKQDFITVRLFNEFEDAFSFFRSSKRGNYWAINGLVFGNFRILIRIGVLVKRETISMLWHMFTILSPVLSITVQQ